jgi:hypothetical protein
MTWRPHVGDERDGAAARRARRGVPAAAAGDQQ